MNLAPHLERIAKRLRHRAITSRIDPKVVYLDRYFLIGGPRDPQANEDWYRFPVHLFLHHFRRSDDADAFHNHPWLWSLSVILTGGYVEHRTRWRPANPRGRHFDPWIDPWGGEYDPPSSRIVRPGDLNFIRRNTFHWVELIEKDCWSVFLAGPRVGDWGFLPNFDRNRDRRVVPHREFYPITVTSPPRA